jgi:Copper transport outer membrane protein, MctB
MIDFRYHVVSLVAVLLALALGLFLGSTTLQGRVFDDLKGRANQVNAENGTLRGQLKVANQQLTEGQQFDSALAPVVLSGQLTGETVALVSAPGVSGSDRSAISAALTQAGAEVTSDVRLSSSYIDPTQSAELGELAKQLPGRGVATASSGAAAADAKLADVLVSRSAKTQVSAARISSTLDAFSAGKLISVAGVAPTRQASLGLLLLPAGDTGTPVATLRAQAEVLLSLGHDLGSTGEGAVVAGPAPVVGVPGVLDLARSTEGPIIKGVSTVDSDDLASGRIATVLVLEAALTGTSGAYGPGPAADSPLPSPSPTP